MNSVALQKNMFWETGPIAQGEIHFDEWSFLHTKNTRRLTPFAKVRLLIDTGASISGIDIRIINGLKLTPYKGQSPVKGVSGIHALRRYKCVLFLNIFGLKGLPLDVLEGDFSGSPYDGIIGRDVLQFCSFSYHGPSDTFELNAPGF